MSKYDEFCELCDDKIKQSIIKMNNKLYEVCNHCKSLAVEDDDAYEFKQSIRK